MQVFFFLAYILIGIIQLIAIMEGLEYALGLHSILAAMLAMVLTYVPLVGSVAGVYGAVKVWDWSLLRAGLLFFWYVPVVIVFLLTSAATSPF